MTEPVTSSPHNAQTEPCFFCGTLFSPTAQQRRRVRIGKNRHFVCSAAECHARVRPTANAARWAEIAALSSLPEQLSTLADKWERSYLPGGHAACISFFSSEIRALIAPFLKETNDEPPTS